MSVRRYSHRLFEAYLRHVLERLPDHPVDRVDELLPSAIAAERSSLRMAA